MLLCESRSTRRAHIPAPAACSHWGPGATCHEEYCEEYEWTLGIDSPPDQTLRNKNTDEGRASSSPPPGKQCAEIWRRASSTAQSLHSERERNSPRLSTITSTLASLVLNAESSRWTENKKIQLIYLVHLWCKQLAVFGSTRICGLAWEVKWHKQLEIL